MDPLPFLPSLFFPCFFKFPAFNFVLIRFASVAPIPDFFSLAFSFLCLLSFVDPLLVLDCDCEVFSNFEEVTLFCGVGTIGGQTPVDHRGSGGRMYIGFGESLEEDEGTDDKVVGLKANSPDDVGTMLIGVTEKSLKFKEKGN